MRQLILKLDDIGRETHRAIFDTVLWSMEAKLHISIGTIGNTLSQMPMEVVDLIKLGIRLGFVEVWNHGNGHIRYDLSDLETAIADLRCGHQAIIDKFEYEPNGFGFPFNKFTTELVVAIRNIYPQYFIYETDFSHLKLISPEFNSLADGQPRLDYFLERVGTANNIPQGIILQAHPPRWSNNGFSEFKSCVEYLVEQFKFSCACATDVANIKNELREKLPYRIYSPLPTDSISEFVELWEKHSFELNKTLSNFKSYFLPRFIQDAEKNYIQVSRVIYPFKPKKILDVGCGLGNWSLPFLLANACESLILNDINSTITKALELAKSIIDDKERLSIDTRNLLNSTDSHGYQIDFLVCSNTFNYLDPIDFFNFAQSAVLPGGRLLLMFQTSAFNKLRYRSSCNSKDTSVLSEVLLSDFAMMLRRVYGVYIDGVRHVFNGKEITKLASMFDFVVESNFIPYGEIYENESPVYECILFRRTTGMKKSILARPDWLSECITSIECTFGSQAFKSAGFPNDISIDSNDCSYGWDSLDHVSAPDGVMLQQVKQAIDALKSGGQQNLTLMPGVSKELSDFVCYLVATYSKINESN